MSKVGVIKILGDIYLVFEVWKVDLGVDGILMVFGVVFYYFIL